MRKSERYDVEIIRRRCISTDA